MAKLPIPFGNPRTYAGHSGVDYPQARGTIFRASGHGRVITKARNARGGYYLWVKYDDIGPTVGYHHMDSPSPLVSVGTEVWEGTPLGYVGSLGTNSTGPHLHSEVAGYATTAGYWSFFNPDDVVSASGSGASVPPAPQPPPGPPPAPEPEPYRERQDDMFQIKIKDNDGKYGPVNKVYYALIGANYLNIDGPYDEGENSPYATPRAIQFGVDATNCTYWKWEDYISSTGKREVWDNYLKSIGKFPA